MGKKKYTEKIISPSGKIFHSVPEMCRAYGISYACYKSRIERGLSQEEALTPYKMSSSHLVAIDYDGKQYDTLLKMCDAHGVSVSTFKNRVNAGLTLEEALTIQRKAPIGTRCQDHEGNSYISLRQMCEHYGVSLQTFRNRLKAGLTLKEALTTPLKTRSKVCKDHLGNIYKSVEEMCRYYGIHKATFLHRINHNWSLEDALVTPPRAYNK